MQPLHKQPSKVAAIKSWTLSGISMTEHGQSILPVQVINRPQLAHSDVSCLLYMVMKLIERTKVVQSKEIQKSKNAPGCRDFHIATKMVQLSSLAASNLRHSRRIGVGRYADISLKQITAIWKSLHPGCFVPIHLDYQELFNCRLNPDASDILWKTEHYLQ